MSGGHYDYKYYHLETLADDIESDFINDGIFETEDWSVDINQALLFGKRPMVKANRIDDATEEQRPIILTEIKRDSRVKCLESHAL